MTLENPVNPIDPENPATDAHGKSDAHSGDPQEPLIPAPTKPEQKPRPHQCEVTCNKKRDWVDKITLGLEAFGLFVLIVYTIFTGLMYCANKKAADAAKSAADTAARQLEMAERGYSGEGEHRIRREDERHSGAKVNSNRSEATLAR